MRYNLAVIRKLVSAAFSDEELKAFCFDHFSDVYQDFTAGQTLGQRVQLLLDFAVRQGQTPRLLAAVAQANPHQYGRFDGELQGPDIGPDFTVKPFEPETIFIPAGPFRMGNADATAPATERPPHTVHLPDFRIGKHPVTVRQYAVFINDRKAHPAPAGWFNRQPPADRLDHPVTDVSWFDAVAYCAWLSEQCKPRVYTLPSEAEWERAGDQSGVAQMLGAVQQWTRSQWGRQPGQPDYGYPYDPTDGREVADPARLPPLARLVHRGGSFKSAPADLRVTARGNALPDSKIAWRGFRVVMVIE
ncbi:MAG: hypothetical protein QG637_1911 [Chloroflexota bacterium]|nr:hypothetical protein [Chloroflexota bacterium]